VHLRPGIYLTITMGMTSLSIVLTVFVLQLHHVTPRRRPAPAWLLRAMTRYVACALCMADHVTDYYACARPGTCSAAIALNNRRSSSKRDVCLVGAFGADLNGIQAGGTPSWLRCTVVERLCLAGKLSLSHARLMTHGVGYHYCA